MTMDQQGIWVFGHGSLIWWTGGVNTIERREGVLLGWHREWTWISTTRHGAPTCSLKPEGQVRGVFLRLAPMTADQDLEQFRQRENRKTEQIVVDIPDVGARTFFWTMGGNLDRFPEFANLRSIHLPKALAERAKRIMQPGPDGILANDYIKRVRAFDPDDELTAEIAGHL